MQQPTTTNAPQDLKDAHREAVAASQRARLLTAFVEEAAEQGYFAVTVSDIVRRAGTAKRTFYEHFSDKEDCFVQAFNAGSLNVIEKITAAAGPVEDPVERIVVGVRAYLAALDELASFAQVFLTYSSSAGPSIAEAWIRWIELLAESLVAWRAESRLTHPEMPELSRMHAIGAVSAINEILRIEFVHHGGERIDEIADQVVAIGVAFLTSEVKSKAD